MATVDVESTRARIRARRRVTTDDQHRGGGGAGPAGHRRGFSYRRVVVTGDALTALAAALPAWVLAERATAVAVTGMALLWPLVVVARSRPGDDVLGVGRPYADVFQALAMLVALMAIGGSVVDVQVLGGALVSATVVLMIGSLLTRAVAGQRLRALRRRGAAVVPTVVVGPSTGLGEVVARLTGDDEQPLAVVAVHAEDPLDPTPVDAVVAAAIQAGARAVCVAPGSIFTGDRLRELGWALGESGTALVTELGFSEVSGHRLRFGRAGASAVVHVRQVRFAGARFMAKSMIERVLAVLGIAVLAPVFAAIAVAVRATSPGPALYRQVRVGRDGYMFTMYKFRTMCADADLRRAELLDSSDGDDGGPMFKMRLDPRITRVGRVLRKYSLDELPQLFNVVRGEMSLVGPRPPLPEEVDRYTTVERRRLRALPGMTGLWQVSGRSDLSWDETIRLDLRYVDNWSLSEDVRLLRRTAGVVIKGTGAY